MRSSNPPIHVCSLSMSPLTEAKRNLEVITAKYEMMNPEERTNDEMINNQVNRARWVELAIEYNRNIQIQYVYQHLGDKGTKPEFRQLKIKNALKNWKRELLRLKWKDAANNLNAKSNEKSINKKKENFSFQRSEIAGKSFAYGTSFDPELLNGLLDVDSSIEELFGFQMPQLNTSIPVHDNIEFESSGACTEFSTIPPTEEDESHNQDYVNKFKKRFREIGDDKAKTVKGEKGRKGKGEQEFAVRKRGIESDKKGKSVVPIIAIISIILLITAFLFYKFDLMEYITLPKPTPTPVPKKGWFSK
jgi:hypothetical protein